MITRVVLILKPRLSPVLYKHLSFNLSGIDSENYQFVVLARAAFLATFAPDRII